MTSDTKNSLIKNAILTNNYFPLVERAEVRDLLTELGLQHPIHIIGEHKIGKTVLLKQIEAHLTLEKKNVVYCDMSIISSPAEFWQRVGSNLDEKELHLLSQIEREKKVRRLDPLHMLWDEVSILKGKNLTQDFYYELRSYVGNGWIRIITSGFKPLIDLTVEEQWEGSHFANLFTTIALPMFNRGEIDKFFEESKVDISSTEKNKMLSYTSGHPYFLQLGLNIFEDTKIINNKWVEAMLREGSNAFVEIINKNRDAIISILKNLKGEEFDVKDKALKEALLVKGLIVKNGGEKQRFFCKLFYEYLQLKSEQILCLEQEEGKKERYQNNEIRKEEESERTEIPFKNPLAQFGDKLSTVLLNVIFYVLLFLIFNSLFINMSETKAHAISFVIAVCAVFFSVYPPGNQNGAKNK